MLLLTSDTVYATIVELSDDARVRPSPGLAAFLDSPLLYKSNDTFHVFRRALCRC